MDYKFKISVVIPIYKVEKYLEETIVSVINQTLGFEKNIQMILVNDGSPDKSELICLKYKKMYPNNIVYVKQENGGVSKARNTGMQYIEGKYVNFLDSDDKWSLDAFKELYNFFEKNREKIDLVSCRMKFFEAKDDYHALDYKFKKSKVIDIFEDYNYIHLHITSSLIKSEVAKRFRFNTDLRYGEDAEFVNEVILKEHKYGVVNTANHFYRKRVDSSSAVQNKEKNLDWYTKTVQYFYKNLMEISKKKYGKVIPYIQYLVMYDLQWRIKTLLPDFLDIDFKNKYINEIKYLLSNIDDNIICEQKNIYAEHKLYLLSLKYNRNIQNELIYKKGRLYFNNIAVYNIRKNKYLFKIDILQIQHGKLLIEGRVKCPLNKELFDIYININSKKKILLELENGKKSIDTKHSYVFTGEKVLYHYTYKVEIPLKKVKKINFLFDYKKEIDNRLIINWGKFSKLSDIEGSYYKKNKYVILYKNKNIYVKSNKKISRIKYEYTFEKNLIFGERKFKVAFTRLLCFINKMLQKKEIWLVSDRDDRVGDNGEHFFKYLMSRKNNKIKTYFVLSKKCEDYPKIKKIGKVIDPSTFRYKILFLLSSKIISSQANDNVINAFETDEKFFRDLLKFKFVFLQHGIIEKDLSKWLKKYDKNISIFITSAKKEYNSIINGDYYYNKEQVKLTGLPRYDRLIDNRKKSIIILPTQRRRLVEWNPNDKYGRTYNPFFKDSRYFKYYNGLINDSRIIQALKKYGYKMKLGIHPLLLKQINDFKGNDEVEILGTIDYQKEFRENALLVTDYSSVAFDFAYLKKPIIYTQFDVDTFYEGQVYDKGYFDYERDGLGPVCYEYETTVQEIIKAIESDCQIKKEYLERIENFYSYFDANNCQRVYEEILEL